MSKIRISALGGLGENGKNMYVVEVNKKIFVLDAGIKYPTVEFYGIDTIIADYEYLVKNKDQVQGFFISHAHEPHMGAMHHILKDHAFPVYGTKLTLALLNDTLTSNGLNPADYKLNLISSSTTLNFGDVTVSFFDTTHNIPESLGIVIGTPDGSIVYSSNFTFDQNVTANYQTSYDLINNTAKKHVLCLLLESLGVDMIGNMGNHFELMHRLNGVFSNSVGRIIISLFSSDLLRIQKCIDIAIEYKKKIAIIGRRTQRIVDIAINLGYIDIPKESLVNLRYIDEKINNKMDDLVVLVVGHRHEPFFMLQRMCKKIDRLIHIDETDNVVIMTSPIPGTEKMAARTMDVLYRTNAKITSIDKKLLKDSHASIEEAKMLVNLLKPKYIVPVIGEYRHQYALTDQLKTIGYQNDSVFLLDNGNVIGFEDGDCKGIVDSIKTSEILIDGAVAGDINDIVLKDRELLAEDGVLLIIANVSPKNKKVICGPEIVSRGFVYVKDSSEMMDGVKNVFNDVSNRHLHNKYINWSDYKNDLKLEINKYLYKETKRSPITIPVIISTEVEND